MRIVQVITRPQRRGAEIFAIQLAEQLLILGHEVTVISLFRSAHGLAFSGKFIRMDLAYRGKLDLQSFWLLSKELRTLQPDIVQANASETLRMCVGSRYFFKGSYKLMYRNANQIGDLLKGNLHKAWNKWLLSKVDGIISVSKASKMDLLNTFSSKKPIEVIPIGINPPQILKSMESEIESMPDSYLIQIGGLVPEKDPLGMLSIFAGLQNQNIHLVFLGSGPLDSPLVHEINRLGLDGRVHLIPNQQNIFPYLKTAKALVMPSKIEGLPGVILEAMFIGVPVIAYGVGGIPEVLKNAETGWCIPPKDQNGFIQAIEEVLAMDFDSRDVILSNAFQLVSSNYSLKKVALQFEDFYKRLLDSLSK